MNRDDTITQILHLTANPRDREGQTRAALDRMGDAELAQTREDLAILVDEGRRVLDAMTPAARADFETPRWQTGGALQRARAYIAKVDERLKTDEYVRAEHVDDLQKVAASVAQWQGIAIDERAARQVADVVSGIRRMAGLPADGHFYRTDQGDTGRVMSEGFGENDLETARRTITSLIRHPLLWSDSPIFPEEAIIEALARMENRMARQPPAAMVALNEPGMDIARAVKADLSLDAPILQLQGAADEGLTWQGAMVKLVRNAPVHILGHVAWSGATIEQAIDMTCKRFQTSNVFVDVLATSTEAAQRIGRMTAYGFHQISPGHLRLSFTSDDLRRNAARISAARGTVGDAFGG